MLKKACVKKMRGLKCRGSNVLEFFVTNLQNWKDKKCNLHLDTFFLSLDSSEEEVQIQLKYILTAISFFHGVI